MNTFFQPGPARFRRLSVPESLFTVVVVLAVLGTSQGCDSQKDSQMLLDGEWLFQIDSTDSGRSEEWFRNEYPKTQWVRVSVPDYWDRYNLGSYDGVGWFARTVDVKDPGEAEILLFHGVDDDADVWVNGVHVGAHAGYSDAFHLNVSGAIRPGENHIVVRVNDAGGPGGIYKPVALVRQAELRNALKSPYADRAARESNDWVRDAVIYEVYVRSFSPEGTFKGVEQRVGELKDLGVTVLWLMPIHPVGDLNRKGSLGSPYAVQDYYGINPEFGTLEDFRSLVDAVHRHGLRIVIDLVANHTAWDSKLMFEHPEWFTTDKTGAIVSPNEDWTDVADLNYEHHELRKYMIAMMEYWVRDVGIDGYRCDVAELVPTDFWELARTRLDKIKPVMMLSEGTIPEHHLRAFDLTYAWNTYDILHKVLKNSTPASEVHALIENESLRFPKGSLRMRFNTNHDKNAWDAPAVEKFGVEGAKLTAALMFTLPGVPLVYNGEEVGNPKRLALFEKVPIEWKDRGGFRRFYQDLARMRRDHPVLRHGEYRAIRTADPVHGYSFMRVGKGETALCVFNFSSREAQISLGLEDLAGLEFHDASTGETVRGASPELTLRPLSFRIFTASGTPK